MHTRMACFLLPCGFVFSERIRGNHAPVGRRMPRSVATVCFAAMLAVFAAGMAHAQGGVKIAGKVEDDGGNPVVGVKVILTPIDANGQPTGGLVSRTKSNKKGKFAFGFAKRGDYNLSVEAEGQELLAATVKMRDGERKPLYGPDGLIEDRSGAVDPANPVVPLGIPRDAFSVDMVLTVGTPVPVASTGGSAADLGAQIVGSGLGEEVEALLAKLESHRYREVLDDVDALIADNAELAPLHYLKGYALVKTQSLPEAEVALRESLRLDPEISGASGLLGQILAEQGRFEEAVPALRLETGRTDDPATRAPVLLALGQALLETGEAAEAATILEEAQTLDPENPLTRVQLVDAYIRTGNEEGAERLLNEALDESAAAILHFNLAANMLRTERWERGAEHLRQSLALDPSMAEAHKFLAQALLAQDKRPEAIAEFEAYVAAAPDAADADQHRRLIDALKQNLEGE